MKSYQYYLKTIGEYGHVREIHYPLVTVVGLPQVKVNELVMFEGGQLGEVFTLKKDLVEILLFSHEPVGVGKQVVRCGCRVSVPVGSALMGKIINPLGRSFFDNSEITNLKETRDLDQQVEGIAQRIRIQRPFLSGTSMVDLLIPLGKGQRQVVIGDRKTGKSSFLLTTVKNQIAEGSLVVYAMIGKKKSEIKKLQEFFVKEKLTSSVVVVASDSFNSPNIIYLTPYSAISIAEYFRDQGYGVLVIFDDLSTHAKFYREMALLAGRFPGRESYPGDIFYMHARLLERAGNFKKGKKGEVAITALPVVETVEGDFTGFIATNIMGMTDGHIFFDSDIFFKGRRPAINVFLSVTRVGRQTQTNLKREINREVTAFLTLYEKTQIFAHFGAELSEKTKTILKMGDRLTAFFNQSYYLIVPETVSLLMTALIWLHVFDERSNEDVEKCRARLIDGYKKNNHRQMFDKLVEADSFHQLLMHVSEKKEELLSLI